MSRKSIIKLTLFFLVVMTGCLVSTQTKAFGLGCGLLASSSSGGYCEGGSGGNQDYSTCTVLSRTDDASNNLLGDNCQNAYGSSNPGSGTDHESELKAQFISNLSWYQNNGQNFQQYDAVWIEHKLDMSDATNDWADRVNNPNVTLKVEDFTFSKNTEYVPGAGVDQYSQASDTQMSLVMYYNGVEEFAIKLNCGNPVGDLNPLPQPKVTVTGFAYYFDGKSSIGLAGVPITTCVPGQNPDSSGDPNTNANPGNGQDPGGGGFGFTVDNGSGFCIRLPAVYVAPDGGQYSGPTVITPHYILPGTLPGGFSGSCNGNTSSYEEQQAGAADDAGSCDYGPMNSFGYHIAYTSYKQPIAMSGTIYYADSNSVVRLSGVTLSTTCGYGSQTSDGSGNFNFTVLKDNGFCALGLPSTVPGPNGGIYSDLVISPNYVGKDPSNNIPFTTCNGHYAEYTDQTAEPGNSPKCGGGNNVNNNGYNFVYLHLYTPPQITASASCSNGGYKANFTATDPTDPTDPITGVTIASGSFTSRTLGGVDRSGVYSYSYDISNWEGYKTTDFTISATDNAGTNTATLSAPPCFTLSCGALSSSSGVLDETKSFTITIKSTIGGLGAPPQGSVAAKPFDIGSTPNIAGLPSSGVYTIPGSLVEGNIYTFVVSFSLPNSSTGSYTINWSLSLPGATDPNTGGAAKTPLCGSSYKVYQQPYLKAYGGGVVAGSNFVSGNSVIGACASTPTAAGIIGWQDNSSGTYIGSSSEEGAFATALINGFGSDNEQVPTGYSTPDVLSFANAPPGSYGFGGNFGSDYCVPDYYQQFVNDSAITTLSPPSGNDTLSSAGVPAGTINISRHYVVLSKNDLYIDENTSYPGAVPATTLASNLPLLYVVVKGANIYIDNSVTQLAGVYIAEPNSAGSGGNIFDCAAGSPPTSPVTDPFSPGNCTNSLVINGSFIAKNVDFQRSSGNITQAGAAGTSCTSPDPNAADAFCYSPLTWLANPFGASSKLPTNSISSVSPTL